MSFDPTRLSDSEWKTQLDELVARLGDSDVSARRQAAARALEWGQRQNILPNIGTVLEHALADGDPEVQRDVALGILSMRSRFGDKSGTALLRHATRSATAADADRARAIAVDLAKNEAADKSGLVGLAADLAISSDPALSAAALQVLLRSPNQSALRTLLGHAEPRMRAQAARKLLEGGPDPQALTALESAVDGDPLTAVPPLAAHRFAAADANGLTALANHKNEVVREMLAQQLLRESEAGRDLTPALPALARLVTDRAHGGVIFHATRAVLAGVDHGLDVSTLVPTLSQYTKEFHYPDDGWASGRDLISDNDRHSYRWGADTQEILDKHARKSAP